MDSGFFVVKIQNKAVKQECKVWKGIKGFFRGCKYGYSGRVFIWKGEAGW
jgi:hypothetical protein